MTARDEALRRNADPCHGCVDPSAVADLRASRPLLLSDARVYVAREDLDRMAALVAAIERTAALPGWEARAMAAAPLTARHRVPQQGVCFGYDFHLCPEGPRLIEINTNAGGAFVNLALLKAQRAPREAWADPADVAGDLADMFVQEWQAGGRVGQPGHVAIVDEHPADQYLYPDFLYCRDLLSSRGIRVSICAPDALVPTPSGLILDGQAVDMVYNRLTDFFLADPAHEALREAWLADRVVLTPHPTAYARLADKRHLPWLGDEAWLAGIGVSPEDLACLAAGVPATARVDAATGEDWWARRKQLFFKPATGFGGKAAYRGANITRKVFDAILAGDYVAQQVAPPPERQVRVDGEPVVLKYDLRCYAYRGRVQFVAARLWQGQTTNFRTPGGGFAPVVVVEG